MAWLASIINANALNFSASAVYVVNSASTAEDIIVDDINAAWTNGEAVSISATSGDLTIKNGVALNSGAMSAQLDFNAFNQATVGFDLGDSISGAGLSLNIQSLRTKFDGSVGKLGNLSVNSTAFSMRQSALEVRGSMLFSWDDSLDGINPDFGLEPGFDFTGKTLRAGGGIVIDLPYYNNSSILMNGATLESANGSIFVGHTYSSVTGAVLNAYDNVSLEAYNIVNASVDAGVDATLKASGDITGGAINAGVNVTLTAYGDIVNASVNAGNYAALYTDGDIIGGAIKAGGDVVLTAGYIQNATVSSSFGSIDVNAYGDIVGGTYEASHSTTLEAYGDVIGATVNAGTGAYIVAGNSAQNLSVSAYDAVIFASGPINGGTVSAAGQATLTAGTSISGVSIVAGNVSLNAPIQAGNTIVVENQAQVLAAQSATLGDIIAGTLQVTSPEIVVDGNVKAQSFDMGGNVNLDGSLQGSGTITGNLTMNGTLAPGNSPGVLNVDGDILFSPLGQTHIELAGLNAGTEYDTVSATGTVTLDGSLNVYLLEGLENTLNGTEVFTIVESSLLEGAFDNLVSGSIFKTADNKGYFTLHYSDDAVSLRNFSVIPEPSIYALMGGLALMGITLTRRKR